jgi:dTDP-4-dehydrorhamnose 3,5-epimerase
MTAEFKKDRQMVTPEGKSVVPLIHDVSVRYDITHPDESGTLCEIYDPAWNFSDAPLVYVYQVTIRPRRVKGWVVHYQQDDRMFVSQGTVKIVLYDPREGSATYGMLNELCVSEHNRGLVFIPRGVYHALQNVGTTDVLFINMPTRPYNHADPDKFRLPLNTDVIPYRFDDRLGW